MANLRWSMRKMDSLTMLLSQNGSAARPQKSCGSLAPSTEVRKHCLLSHCCNAIFFHLIQRWICLPPLQSASLWNLWGDGTVLPKWAFGLWWTLYLDHQQRERTASSSRNRRQSQGRQRKPVEQNQPSGFEWRWEGGVDLEGPCAGPAVFGDRSVCLVTQVGLPEHSSGVELLRKHWNHLNMIERTKYTGSSYEESHVKLYT